MQFIPPAGYQPTFIDLGNDVSDSDVDSLNGPNTTEVFNVPSGGIKTNIDAGFYQCVQIGDLVWYDINKNDRWETNENGINGLEVKLWRKHLGEWQPWRSQLTHLKPGSPSLDGYFSFCEAPGQYYLEVIMPPQGLVRARPDIGTNEEIDSDITNGNGVSTTNTFVVLSGQSKTDLGAGFYPMAIAGNLVWLDENLNGLQDPAEQRMENVKVEAILQATGEVIHTVYTDAEGGYQIDYLEKQNYYLRFTPPAGYAPTMPRLGQDSIDSDVDHTFGANTTRAFSMLPDVTYDNIDMGLIYGVLPVDWLDVNVRRENNVHMVYWRTAREVNVSHYEVERRLEHEPEFYVIPGKVKAHGNSTAILDYNHADKDVNAVGTYIYRVKQVDYDGQYTYSRWVKVSHSGEPLVDLYPNPARNDASVQVILPYEASLGIELYDQTSRLVKVVRKPQMQDQGDWLFTIDLQDVVPGTYNVVVTIGTEVTQRKLIRVK
jgi:hypothetical protein